MAINIDYERQVYDQGKTSPPPLAPLLLRTLFQNKEGLWYTYIGEIKNGLPNGQGVALYRGDYRGHDMTDVKYTGGWKDGNEHGFGILTKDGCDFLFEGEHKEGVANGYGTRIGTSGDKYEGFFKRGKKHGYGTFLYDDGAKYVGEWYEGSRHGWGSYCGIYGEIAEGVWRKDRMFTGIRKKYIIRGDGFPERHVIKEHKATLEANVMLAVMNKLGEENKLVLGTKKDIGELLRSIGYPPLDI